MSFVSLPPTGSIGFKVTGLIESVRGLDGVMKEWPIVRSAVLNEAARFLTNEAKRNVHVVSGDLKNSIGIEPGFQRASSVIVSAKMPYARIENERPGNKFPSKNSKGPYGAHNYFTKAIQATTRDFSSKIKVNFDKLWARHVNR